MNGTHLDLQLLEKMKPELTAFCYRMLGSIDDADDAVQEIFIRVWQSWSSFRQDSSPKTWIYRIASNLCLDKLRQAKRRVLPIDLSEPASSIVEPRETLPDSAWIWLAPDLGGIPRRRSSARIPCNSASLRFCRLCLPDNEPY